MKKRRFFPCGVCSGRQVCPVMKGGCFAAARWRRVGVRWWWICSLVRRMSRLTFRGIFRGLYVRVIKSRVYFSKDCCLRFDSRSSAGIVTAIYGKFPRMVIIKLEPEKQQPRATLLNYRLIVARRNFPPIKYAHIPRNFPSTVIVHVCVYLLYIFNRQRLIFQLIQKSDSTA